MALLRVLSGEHKGKVFPLETEKLILGRESNDIPILDQGVSRQHAEFFRIGEMYLVRDLESRNGTFVNDQRIDEWVLRAGDRVQVGNTQFAFEDRFTRPRDSRVIKFANTADKPGSTISLRLPDEGEEEHRDRLKILYRISKILGTGEELEETMQKVARTMARALNADHVYLFSFEEGEEEFAFVSGFDKEPADGLQVSRTILRRVRDEGLPILSSDAMLDERFQSSQSVMVQQIKSLLCVPLTVMNHPVGAFYATNSKLTEVFSPEDLELATIIGMVVGNSLEMWRRTQSQSELYRGVLRMLAEVAEVRNPQVIKGRSERVASYSSAIARAYGFPEEKVNKLWITGLLHDIGAIGLSEDELKNAVNVEQRKAKKATELLEKLPELSDVAPAIIKHTERLDGSGYPEGLEGEDNIPKEAQIVGLACVLEDLLNRGGDGGTELSTKEALVKIRELAPEQFSASVVNGLLIAYRQNRLFKQDRQLFRLDL